MDELDRKIIALLQLDGRASNAKIAREVSVSEGTVRRRLRRLVNDDVVKIIAVPNLEKHRGVRGFSPLRALWRP